MSQPQIAQSSESAPPTLMAAEDQVRWFKDEVQPHEAALRAYLRGRFPSLSDCDDLVQESYLRILRVKSAGKIRYAKAFLFTIARNAALDMLFKRRPAISVDAFPDCPDSIVLETSPNAAEAVNQKQELEILAEAIKALPARCREVMTLRYKDELSVKQIAARLGVSTETVKTHLVRGVDLCTSYFHEKGLLADETP